MASSKNNYNAEGLIHYTFSSICFLVDFLLCYYIVISFADCQIFLNNLKVYSILFVTDNYKVTVLSLPHFMLNFSIKNKTLHDLLGKKVSIIMSISLAKDFKRDSLTLVVTNNTLDLLITPNPTSCTEDKNLAVSKGYYLVQLPHILPLYSNIKVL